MLTGETDALYWPWLVVALLAPVVGERILAYHLGIDRRPGADAARTVLVVLGCLTGLIGLYCGAAESQRAWGWLAMAGGAAITGIAFREGRYRWTAMIAFVAAAVLVTTGTADQRATANVVPFALAAIVVVGILVASWAVAMRSQWTGQGHRGMTRDDG